LDTELLILSCIAPMY